MGFRYAVTAHSLANDRAKTFNLTHCHPAIPEARSFHLTYPNRIVLSHTPIFPHDTIPFPIVLTPQPPITLPLRVCFSIQTSLRNPYILSDILDQRVFTHIVVFWPDEAQDHER